VTDSFNWQSPDYIPILKARLARLQWLRSNPANLPAVRTYYRENPWDFINDWGMLYEPRNAEIGLPNAIPFMLFPKQIDWLKWVVTQWKARDGGVTEKSRDCGVSWLSVALGATLSMFYPGLTIGYGSRKQDYVDKRGSPKALFWKAREFIKRVPPEFTGGWDERVHSIENLIRFPTGSVMTGEVGDGIGRGDRASIYFVDEAAHLERPEIADQALSATTNCRIDISSANGTDNPFYAKVSGGRVNKFTFHWRDDPRKDQAWYDREVYRLDPVTVAQEIDINYSASKTGILIPSAWINAAVDADKVLGFEVRGAKRGALDVADEGIDLNAFCSAMGVRIDEVTAWSGKGDDIFGTVQRAFELCDEWGLDEFDYDADGLGAGVRGDARVVNSERLKNKVRQIKVNPFRGSGAVFQPDKAIPQALPRGEHADAKTRKNADFFANAKAQGWWNLRVRFQRTYRAVEAKKSGQPILYDFDDLIVLNGRMIELAKVILELSQPTYTQTTAGKILVDKAPKGTKSPNYGDSVMIRMAPRRTSFLSYLD
jgi:hypothetical protein